MSTAPQRSSYANGSVANMLRSLLVICAILAVAFLGVGRVNSVTPQTVDDRVAAQGVADRTGRAVAVPDGLGDGWTATSARYVRSTDGLMMWHAGYTTPDGRHVAVQQVVGATDNWVSAQTIDPPPGGVWTDADGRRWERLERVDKDQRSLLDRPTDPKAVTTLVTGTASYEQLERFAEALTDVRPTPGSTPDR